MKHGTPSELALLLIERRDRLGQGQPENLSIIFDDNNNIFNHGKYATFVFYNSYLTTSF